MGCTVWMVVNDTTTRASPRSNASKQRARYYRRLTHRSIKPQHFPASLDVPQSAHTIPVRQLPSSSACRQPRAHLGSGSPAEESSHGRASTRPEPVGFIRRTCRRDLGYIRRCQIPLEPRQDGRLRLDRNVRDEICSSPALVTGATFGWLSSFSPPPICVHRSS